MRYALTMMVFVLVGCSGSNEADDVVGFDRSSSDVASLETTSNEMRADQPCVGSCDERACGEDDGCGVPCDGCDVCGGCALNEVCVEGTCQQCYFFDDFEDGLLEPWINYTNTLDWPDPPPDKYFAVVKLFKDCYGESAENTCLGVFRGNSDGRARAMIDPPMPEDIPFELSFSLAVYQGHYESKPKSKIELSLLTPVGNDQHEPAYQFVLDFGVTHSMDGSYCDGPDDCTEDFPLCLGDGFSQLCMIDPTAIQCEPTVYYCAHEKYVGMGMAFSRGQPEGKLLWQVSSDDAIPPNTDKHVVTIRRQPLDGVDKVEWHLSVDNGKWETVVSDDAVSNFSGIEVRGMQSTLLFHGGFVDDVRLCPVAALGE